MPKPLAFKSFEGLLAKLRPNVDGVVFQARSRQATYLPRVWQQIPDKRMFMTALARRAGLSMPDRAWQPQNVKILTYEAETFREPGW